MEKKILIIQEALEKENCDGWLIYDFRRSNPLGCKVLKISNEELLTRRFFVWIGKDGNVTKIVHRIENPLQHIPGKELTYSTWEELNRHLSVLLSPAKKVMMEYSKEAAIPEISRVDGGTIDLIRKHGIEVISSGNLLQEFTNVWDSSQIESHYYAADVLQKAFEKIWERIRNDLAKGNSITEYDVQQFALRIYEDHGCITDCPPICAVNQNSANPHYVPKKNNCLCIKKGDIIMLDLGCKQNKARSVYADLTKMAIAGENPEKKQQDIFAIVKNARDTALAFIKTKYQVGETLCGYEVDDCCRSIIRQAGYDHNFTHRTGHNIDENEHGPGAHIDNLETHDFRNLLPNTCFSIEPGIYLPGEFGVRLECNVLLLPSGVMEVTGGLQKEFIALF